MAGRKKKPTPEPTGLQVGDRVRYRFVFTDVEAEIVEDRGPLGVGGKRVLGIRYKLGDEERYTEVHADELVEMQAQAQSR
jgi:hypothetical protein